MDVCFILVEPAVPENIGAAARAINTMGFSELRLVNPRNFPDKKARWLAHGSHAVLDNAGIFEDIDTATEDLDFLIGSSAKKRRIKSDQYPLGDIPGILQGKKVFANQTGILFGCEESGLTNAELKKCDLISYIPQAQPFPSLNLAQAVMLYAYTLSSVKTYGGLQPSGKTGTSYRSLKKKTGRLLKEIGIPEQDARHGRILERLVLLQASDLRLLHSVCNVLEKHLE